MIKLSEEMVVIHPPLPPGSREAQGTSGGLQDVSSDDDDDDDVIGDYGISYGPTSDTDSYLCHHPRPIAVCIYFIPLKSSLTV